MNWSAIAAIVSCLTLLATPISAAYFYGKTSQKVDANERDLQELGVRVNEHDRTLGELKGWRSSFVPR